MPICLSGPLRGGGGPKINSDWLKTTGTTIRTENTVRTNFFSLNLWSQLSLLKMNLKKIKKNKNKKKSKLEENKIKFIPNSDEFYIYAQDADLSVRTAPGRGGA